MSSTWPILLVVIGLVFAAFWYDANVASAGARSTGAPARAALVR